MSELDDIAMCLRDLDGETQSSQLSTLIGLVIRLTEEIEDLQTICRTHSDRINCLEAEVYKDGRDEP